MGEMRTKIQTEG